MDRSSGTPLHYQILIEVAPARPLGQKKRGGPLAQSGSVNPARGPPLNEEAGAYRSLT